MGQTELCQALLVFMQRLSGDLEDELMSFGLKCLDHTDIDVRYQAFCLCELRECDTPEYLERVKGWLESRDEDFRIVAIQSLARLRPEWAEKALEERAHHAFGVEAFHILLTQIRICPVERRESFAAQLIPYLKNERFAFAAVQALGEYGNSSATAELLDVAQSFMAEPTLRVAAAYAAARLGSEEGKKWLKKFSSSRHGNPSYAKELLDALCP